VDPVKESAVAHEFAVRFALIAFATAAVQGIGAGAAFEPTLKVALVVLAAFYGVGYVCGEIARRTVEESVQADVARRKSQPAGPEPSGH
jgi:hypothetical protein